MQRNMRIQLVTHTHTYMARKISHRCVMTKVCRTVVLGDEIIKIGLTLRVDDDRAKTPEIDQC